MRRTNTADVMDTPYPHQGISANHPWCSWLWDAAVAALRERKMPHERRRPTFEERVCDYLVIARSTGVPVTLTQIARRIRISKAQAGTIVAKLIESGNAELVRYKTVGGKYYTVRYQSKG